MNPPSAFPHSPIHWPALLARVLVAATLIVSGALKASAPAEEFSVVLESYNILPQGMSLTLAVFLPWVELIVGWSLLLGYFTRQAAAAACAMSLAFLGALLSTKARGINLPNCGCFGGTLHPTPSAAMAIDFALAALSVIAWRKAPAGPSLDDWTQTE